MSLENFPLACEGVVTIPLLSLLLQSSQMSHCMGGGKAHPETAQFIQNLIQFVNKKRGGGISSIRTEKQQMSEECE